MMCWSKILEEVVVNCIKNNDYVENYKEKGNDVMYFMLTEEAQKYIAEVRKRYMKLSEAINCMGPEDFIDEEEFNYGRTDEEEFNYGRT